MKYRVEIKLVSKFSESWFPGEQTFRSMGEATDFALGLVTRVGAAVDTYRVVDCETDRVVKEETIEQ